MTESCPEGGSVRFEIPESIGARSELGQHFLRSEPIATWLVDLVAQWDPTQIVEVGAGLGTLSRITAERGHALWAIEKDQRLIRFLESRLAPFGDRVRVTTADVFTLDLSAHLLPSSVLLAVLPFDHDLATQITKYVFDVPQVACGLVVVPSTVATAAAELGTPMDGLRFETVGTVARSFFWPVPTVDLHAVTISRVR
ncbi:MAG: rRNA adenine N-6-methyltransferase family protein [Pseudonocardiaceae bacterium]